MNNEIKELYFNQLTWEKGIVCGFITFYKKMTPEEYNELATTTYKQKVLCNKDYITNLQEELEKYRNYVDKNFLYTYEELQDKVINLQTIINNMKLYNELLENKINKAVEYIKDDMYCEPNELNGLVDGEHLLNILKGEEK